MQPKLGILAGGGELPRRLISLCQTTGRDFFVIAFDGQSDPDAMADIPHAWMRMGAAGKILDRLHAENVKDLVMTGRMRRPSLGELKPDGRGAKILARIGKRWFGDDNLLSALAAELEAEGFRVVGVDEILTDLLLPEGNLGALAPAPEDQTDIERGIEIARVIGAADIGQAVIIQEGVVIAVEAAEGTDGLLRRAKSLLAAGEGGVLVKIKKPGQDRRIDLPTIGVTTVEMAADAGMRGIVADAGNTLVMNRDDVARAADETGLFVLGARLDRA